MAGDVEHMNKGVQTIWCKVEIYILSVKFQHKTNEICMDKGLNIHRSGRYA